MPDADAHPGTGPAPQNPQNPNPHTTELADGREAVPGLDPSVGAILYYCGGPRSAPNEHGEIAACCPLHEDRSPSLSVNIYNGVWHCFSCPPGSNGGDLIQLLRNGEGFSFHSACIHAGLLMQQNPSSGAIQKTAGMQPAPKRSSSGAPLQQLALLYYSRVPYEDPSSAEPEARELFEFLRARGIPVEVAQRCWIGLNGARFSVPIRDASGKLLDIKRYWPHYYEAERYAADGKPTYPKWQHLAGGSSQLWAPDPETWNQRDIVLCAGEWDALAGLAAGLHTVTATSGEGHFRPEWAEAFRGKRVLIVYDDDEQGRKGAAHARQALAPVCDWVGISIPQPPEGWTDPRSGKSSGYDLCDYLGAGRPLEDLISFEGAALPLSPEQKAAAQAMLSPQDDLGQRMAVIAGLTQEVDLLAAVPDPAERQRQGLLILQKLAKQKPTLGEDAILRSIAKASGSSMEMIRHTLRSLRREQTELDALAPRPEKTQVAPPHGYAQHYDRATGAISYGIWLPTGSEHDSYGGGWDSLRPYIVTSKPGKLPVEIASFPEGDIAHFPEPPRDPWNWSVVEGDPYNFFDFAAGSIAAPDTAALLDELTQEFDRYFYFDNPGYARVLALWTMHTYIHDAFDATGYLSITGMRGSGKSNVLTLLSQLAFNGRLSVSITPAVMFRAIDRDQRTVLIDEGEFARGGERGKDERSQELLGIIREGYKRGAYAERHDNELGISRHFCVYSPKAIAAMGWLESALEDRSINIPTSKQANLQKEWFAPSKREADWQVLRSKLYCWALAHALEIQAAAEAAESYVIAQGKRTELLRGRRLENWLPLLTIAVMADADHVQQVTETACEIAARKIAEQGSADLEALELNALYRMVGHIEPVQPVTDGETGGWYSSHQLRAQLESELGFGRYDGLRAITQCVKGRLGLVISGRGKTTQGTDVRVMRDRAVGPVTCYRLTKERIQERAATLQIELLEEDDAPGDDL